MWQRQRLVVKPSVFSITPLGISPFIHSHLAHHCLSASFPSCLFLTSSQVGYEPLSQVLSLSCSETPLPPPPRPGLRLTLDKVRVLTVAHKAPHSLPPSPACPQLPLTHSAQPNEPPHLRPFAQALPSTWIQRISMLTSTLQVFAQILASP